MLRETNKPGSYYVGPLAPALLLYGVKMTIASPPVEILSQVSQNDATQEGGIVTPFPLWRRATRSVCSFDGGSRFSVSVDPLPNFCHIGRGVLQLLEEHAETREPVRLWDGVTVRGASADERAFFRDYPAEGAACFVCDEFRVILRLSVLDCVSCPSRNHCVVILGWRAFVENPSIQAAYLRVCEFLRRLGLVATLDRINRVDVNATVDGVPMQLVRDAFCGGFFCSRSAGRLFDNRPGVLGTLYFGGKSSPVMLRVYDKSAELRSAIADPEARDKLRLLRSQFGDESLTHLTRFEFELHRGILTDFDVSDFCELEKRLSAILKYLCEKWLRVTETKHEKYAADRHRDRRTVAPWWAFLASRFAAFADTLTASPVQVSRGSHRRTTGAKSIQAADRWAAVAFEEAYRSRVDSGENIDPDELLSQFVGVLRVRIQRGEVGRGSVGTGAALAWNFALEKEL